MGNPTTNDELLGDADPSGESTLRGEALAGSERRRAADHTAYKKSRNPDTVVRVDDEDDTLYSDGLEVEDDTKPLGTAGGDSSLT
jgi:hypothetical protein